MQFPKPSHVKPTWHGGAQSFGTAHCPVALSHEVPDGHAGDPGELQLVGGGVTHLPETGSQTVPDGHGNAFASLHGAGVHVPATHVKPVGHERWPVLSHVPPPPPDATQFPDDVLHVVPAGHALALLAKQLTHTLPPVALLEHTPVTHGG